MNLTPCVCVGIFFGVFVSVYMYVMPVQSVCAHVHAYGYLCEEQFEFNTVVDLF